MPFTEGQDVQPEEVKDPVKPLVDPVDVEPEEIKEPVAPVFLDPVEGEQRPAAEPKRASEQSQPKREQEPEQPKRGRKK